MKKTTAIVRIFIVYILFLPAHKALSFDDGIKNVDIHGFISQGYMKSTDNNEYMVYGTDDGTFQFNEIGINFSTSVSDILRIGTQLMAYDLGQLGNDEVIVDWAYADFSFREYLGIRAGLVKIPFALYNTQRDVDLLRSTIFLPQSVYGEFFRDAFSRLKGFGIYGALPFGFYYQIVYGVVPVRPEDGLTQTFATVLGTEPLETKIGSDYIWNLQWVSPWNPFGISSFKLGASAYTANDFEISGRGITYKGVHLDIDIAVPHKPIEAFVSSIEIIIDEFIFVTEYWKGYVDFKITNPIIGTLLESATHSEQYYFSLSYRLTDWLEVCGFYSVNYYDKYDRSGKKKTGIIHDMPSDGYLKDSCIALRFDINDNWLIKCETHIMNGTLYVVGDFTDDKKNWYFNAIKLTYSF